MTVSTRISQRFFNAILVILTFVISAMYAVTTNAQSSLQMGFEGRFGVRSVNVENLPSLGSAKASLSGGSVGFVVGNDVVRAAIGVLGYYESDGGIDGTMQLTESSFSVNVYPLSLIFKSPVVEPYLTGGLSFDRMSFHGYYLNGEPGNVNYSYGVLPELGKVKEVNALAGAGIAFRIVDNHHFVQAFTEVKYGYNLSSTGTTAFSDTHTAASMIATAGVRFGMNRR